MPIRVWDSIEDQRPKNPLVEQQCIKFKVTVPEEHRWPNPLRRKWAGEVSAAGHVLATWISISAMSPQNSSRSRYWLPPPCLKKRSIFYNLKRFELIKRIFVSFGILYAEGPSFYKCMHNFPLHLSCDLTLPGNTLHVVTEYARCIPSWMSKNCIAFRRLH